MPFCWLTSSPGVDIRETDSDLVRAAPLLLKEYDLGLRAGDALHLAFCLRLKRAAACHC